MKSSNSDRDFDVAEALEFPATPAQSYYWAYSKSHPADPCLNIAARWLVTGNIHLPTFERAWQMIVDRHEALRTKFIERDRDVIQVVTPISTFKISLIDLRALPDGQRLVAAEKLAKEEASKPFDVGSVPLFRITLLQLANHEAQMLLTTHHLVSDCWANLTLVREFGELFDALAIGTAPNLAPVAMQFGDYSAWYQAWHEAGGARDASDFWRSELESLPPFIVPTDRPPPAAPTRRGEIFGLAVEDRIIANVTSKAKSHGATMFAFGLATFATVLSRWSNQNEVVLTTQIAARDEVDLETVVGPFINTVVLRLPISPREAFSDLLSSALETVSDALEHRALPFESMLNFAPSQKDDRRGPLWGINFQVLHNSFLRDAKGRGLAIRGIPSISPGAKHDLNFYLVERNGHWRVQCEYDPDLFNEATVERLVQTFIAALEAVSIDPTIKIANIPAPRSLSKISAIKPVAAKLPVVADELAVREIGVARAPEVPDVTNEQEQRLLNVWQRVLGPAEIGLNSNFFELGGHSLSAIKLVKEVNKIWQCNLTVSALFTSPTLRGFAALLPIADGNAAPANIPDWQIVPIQSEGDKPPIIAINNTMIYYNLSRKLGSDRPFISVQLFDPENPDELTPRAFEDIASDYVRIIRRVRPKGPYYLLGHCVAGALAFEIARQLRNLGERVPLVVMADTWRPGFRNNLPRVRRFLANMSYRLHVARHHLKTIYDGKETLTNVIGKYRAGEKILNCINAVGLFPQISFGKEDWSNRWFLPHLEDARAGYNPRKSGEPIVLYCSDEIVTHFTGTHLGWDTIGEPWIHAMKVPGWHTDMFTGSGLERIASDLAERLTEADRNSGVPS